LTRAHPLQGQIRSMNDLALSKALASQEYRPVTPNSLKLNGIKFDPPKSHQSPSIHNPLRLAMPDSVTNLPYKIACLVDLRDEHGNVLLLRRKKAPNLGLCSPIGGKLEMALGESPAQSAQRETLEEVGLDLPIERFQLAGIISEKAYEGKGHWLIFYYRVTGPVSTPARQTPDGSLEWFTPQDIDQGAIPLPQTDRQIIWPLVKAHESAGSNAQVFAVHIECTGPDFADLSWSVQQPPCANFPLMTQHTRLAH
jgi:8-oxo-dGTP diphosphatase